MIFRRECSDHIISYQWVIALFLAVIIGFLVILLFITPVDNFFRANIPNDIVRIGTIFLLIAACVYLLVGIVLSVVIPEHDCRKATIYDNSRNFDGRREIDKDAREYLLKIKKP